MVSESLTSIKMKREKGGGVDGRLVKCDTIIDGVRIGGGGGGGASE